jgi:hypothetical protein
MFDLLSTAELTAASAIVVFFLSSILSTNTRQRLLIAAALAGWFCLVLAAGATGAFSVQQGIGTAGIGLAVVIPVVVLSLLVLGNPQGRDRVARAPLTALVGVQSQRVLGISFVLLYAAKRLPAPFAPVAGWGDVAVGVLAMLLLFRLLRKPASIPSGALVLWNVLGVADLVIAVFLGATSSPGPIQLFHGEQNSAAMATLPWILIPCFLVPVFLFLHLCTLYRLRKTLPAGQTSNLPPIRMAAQSS